MASNLVMTHINDSLFMNQRLWLIFGNCFLGILLFVKNRNKLITVVLWHVINGSILGFVLWWLIIYDSFKLHKVFWFGTHRLSHCLSPPNGRFRINCSEPVTVTSRYMCQTKKIKWGFCSVISESERSEWLKVDGLWTMNFTTQNCETSIDRPLNSWFSVSVALFISVLFSLSGFGYHKWFQAGL